jgi:flagellin-specific chaperone FliS
MGLLGAQNVATDVEIAAYPHHVLQIQRMIADFERLAAELDRDVRAEEERTGIRDLKNFAYSTLAKAAAQRRENLIHSVAVLRRQIEAAGAAPRPETEKLQAART